MTTQEVKDQCNLQKWASIIKECRSSALPVSQWCKKNGIPQGNYYYWLKKLRHKSLEILPSITTETVLHPVSTDNSVFARLSVPQQHISSDVSLSFNGVEIGLNNTATAELIQSVLLAVKQLC